MKKFKILLSINAVIIFSLILPASTLYKDDKPTFAIHKIIKNEISLNNKSVKYTAEGLSQTKASSNYAPGVYIEEIPSYLPIEGIKTSVAGFLGVTEKGPIEPQLVTSYNGFVSIYGLDSSSNLTYSVKGFFENGGQELYIARVVPASTNTKTNRFTKKINNPELSDYLGNSDINKGPLSGLYALGMIDEITILYSPDAQSVEGLNEAMIAQCEEQMDRIVIMESALGETRPEPLNDYDSTYAAYYHPWLQIQDNISNQAKMVPPGGYVAGMYCANDYENGVHKAPANIAIKGITGLEKSLTAAERDRLSIDKVNPIIYFAGRGTLVYGARTLTNYSEYKYICHRRYINYIEESISESLEWTVFEPDGIVLQNKIKSLVTDFLNSEWRNGAILGNQQNQAFFVKTGQMNAYIDGVYKPIIYIEAGVALIRPAEFLIISIGLERD